ncbi:MAG: hypothetical protein WC760_04635 [Bacteroidia bacterium]
MKHLIDLVFILFLFALSGCDILSGPDCDEQKTLVSNFHQFQRDKIHYKGFEALVFLRNGVDTHTFVGTGMVNDYEYRSWGNTNPECPSDIAKLEFAAVTFQSSTFNSPIFYKIVIKEPDGYPHLIINFNSQYFYDHLPSGTPKYDSLLIAEKFYKNIYFMSDNGDPETELYYLLINNSDGVLKFKFQNGDIWELIKKVQ